MKIPLFLLVAVGLPLSSFRAEGQELKALSRTEPEARQEALQFLSPKGVTYIRQVVSAINYDGSIHLAETFVDLQANEKRTLNWHLSRAVAGDDPLARSAELRKLPPTSGMWVTRSGAMRYVPEDQSWKVVLLTSPPRLSPIFRKLRKEWYLMPDSVQAEDECCGGGPMPTVKGTPEQRVASYQKYLALVQSGKHNLSIVEKDGLLTEIRLLQKGKISYLVENSYPVDSEIGIEAPQREELRKASDIVLRPYAEKSVPVNGSGYGLDISSNAVVQSVLRHSPGYDAGVRPGDTILTIDSTPFGSNYREVVTRLKRSQQVVLTLKRKDGSTFTASLPKRPYPPANQWVED